jgi:MFS family permease
MSTEESPRHWVERLRLVLPEGSRRRRWYDSFFLEVEPPIEFTEPHAELVRRLTPPASAEAGERSKEILAGAQAAFAEAEARVEGAERRATTLQGAVAIAVSVLLAGGALLSDPSKVHGEGWRACLALALFAVTGCLVMAGARALAATALIRVFNRPTPAKALERAQMDPVEARIDLAAETLKDFGANDQVAAWKVAYLGAAAWWFRGALIGLLVLAILLCAFIAFADPMAAGTGTGAPLSVPPETPRSR